MGKSARSLRASSFLLVVTATGSSYPGRSGVSGVRSGLGNPRLEGCGKRLAHGFELDPVEDVLEEAANDQPLGVGAREPSRHGVEELLAVDPAHGGTVRATDVVRQDLQPGDRDGV